MPDKGDVGVGAGLRGRDRRKPDEASGLEQMLIPRPETSKVHYR